MDRPTIILNLYTVLLLCATCISILLGLSVYSLNRKATVNWLFMLVMLTNAYWAFCHFMMAQSASFGEAELWVKALFLWPFLDALMLHFALVFTESSLLKNKLVYVVLYLPALFFSFLDISTNLIYAGPALESWGYTNAVQMNSAVTNVYGVWSGIFSLLVLFCFASYYNRVIDKVKKRQTEFMVAGFSIPIVVSLFTDSLFPVMGLDFPVMGPIFGSVTSVFVVYAMIKWELFSFRAEIAVENVFSAMPDSVVLVSLSGVVIKVNRSLLELSGYLESELIGQSLSDLTSRGNILDVNGVMPKLSQLNSLREVRNFEMTFSTKSGERRTGMLSASVVADNNGHDVGYAFILHDITSRKLMEKKLLRTERLASIGELAGLVGHDLRNPLSGIRGAAYYLKRKHAEVYDGEDLSMFDSIDKSINYSNKIINDLLDYSADLCPNLTHITPHALMQASLATVQVPDNVVVIDETSNVPSLLVDEVMMHRGFEGILKNCLEAMPEGGKLHLKSVVEGGFVVFTFADSGLGMNEETLSKLWMPLFTTKAKGMGFGLAICRRIVEAHGGHISAVSAIGQGTTVRVELPLAPSR